ncbi:MAG TPA: helix-turn-helix domain-containing protein [Gemmatimonadaceae bacterium]
MDNRQRILEAALRVFAEHGFRGATTRRIADAAGVNEVTLFRLFGSKEALLMEASELHARQRSDAPLPDVPGDPLRDVTAWASAQLRRLEQSRALIRKCLADIDEHPHMATCVRPAPMLARRQIREYARRLVRQRGLTLSADRIDTACAMLQGTLFADAMGREMVPGLYPPRRQAAVRYAGMFLTMLGLSRSMRARATVRARRRAAS